jgi:hypothetical protein
MKTPPAQLVQLPPRRFAGRGAAQAFPLGLFPVQGDAGLAQVAEQRIAALQQQFTGGRVGAGVALRADAVLHPPVAFDRRRVCAAHAGGAGANAAAQEQLS